MKKFIATLSMALLVSLVSTSAIAQIAGVSGGTIVSSPQAVAPLQVTPAPSTHVVSSRSHTVPTLPSVAVCQREVNTVQSVSPLACPTEDQWAHLQQTCPPHGAAFTRAFETFVRAHCPAADMNILERTRGRALAPLCVGNAQEVRDHHNQVVECSCAEGTVAVRLWSRRSGRPRVDCFGSQLRANVVTQEWVRQEIADTRLALVGLCRPNADGEQTLHDACSSLRDTIDRIANGNEAAPAATAQDTTATSSTVDVSGIQTRLNGVDEELNRLTSRMHDVECRIIRLEGGELPSDCTNLPAYNPPTVSTAASSTNHHFDLGASVYSSLRLADAPASVGGGVNGTWRYRFPGSEGRSGTSTDLYLRGEVGVANFGADVGSVFGFGGGTGVAFNLSSACSVLLGASVRAFVQPGDDTFRHTRGPLRGWNVGPEIGVRASIADHWSFRAMLGVQYGQAWWTTPAPTLPGGVAWMNFEGLALTPEVGVTFTF